MEYCKQCRYLNGQVCESPNLIEKDPVSAEVVRQYIPASICRSDGQWARQRKICGPKSIWFKQINPTLLERLTSLFTKEQP